MAIPTKPTYTHGSTGSAPSSALDYANGDAVDEAHFDYYVNTPLEKIKALIDALNALDSDDDGTVDAADTAALFKGNDIDSNGDGVVDEAETTNAYKGNDLDSNGDGVVDDSDQYDGTAPSDGSSGHYLRTDGSTVSWEAVAANSSLVADGSGVVETGDAANMYTTGLADGETLDVTAAALLQSDGQAAPTGLNLVIATLDNSGGGSSQVTAISGDGSTVYDDATGTPLVSYTNGTGSHQTVMIAADNGHFGSGSGSEVDMFARAEVQIN